MLSPFSIQGLLYPPIRCTLEITLGVVNWGPDVKKGFRGSKTMLSMDRQAVVPCSSHAELRLRAQRPPRPLLCLDIYDVFPLQYDGCSLCSELTLETYSSDKICYFLSKVGSVTTTHPPQLRVTKMS